MAMRRYASIFAATLLLFASGCVVMEAPTQPAGGVGLTRVSTTPRVAARMAALQGQAAPIVEMEGMRWTNGVYFLTNVVAQFTGFVATNAEFDVEVSSNLQSAWIVVTNDVTWLGQPMVLPCTDPLAGLVQTNYAPIWCVGSVTVGTNCDGAGNSACTNYVQCGTSTNTYQAEYVRFGVAAGDLVQQ